MGELYEFSDSREVLDKRQAQIEQLRSGGTIEGRLTVPHIKIAIAAGGDDAKRIRALRKACAKVRAAQEAERRLASERDERLKEMRIAGWSWRALEEMSGLDQRYVRRVVGDRGVPTKEDTP